MEAVVVEERYIFVRYIIYRGRYNLLQKYYNHKLKCLKYTYNETVNLFLHLYQ